MAGENLVYPAPYALFAQKHPAGSFPDKKRPAVPDGAAGLFVTSRRGGD
ncbi:hypothetical protein [Sphingomonas aerophila]|jgi:hypothetical protein|uniref:Uncharacterized protein n=1 Tax=Sphingomonas aerophila TaxID=1344948 RepID=A0A7W9EVX3_9SPHN|nr:hypothetical protein [Sphingomonas aerophila]MBB5716691.1 hypothetical protein [Sphingomonas aerophila]